MRRHLRRSFETPKTAEMHFFPSLTTQTGAEHTPLTTSLQTFPLVVSMNIQQVISKLTVNEQLELLGKVYQSLALISAGIHIPADFLQLAINGMAHLKDTGRSNLLYNLARGLGVMRPDNTDSLIPAKRMPMGLLEYCTNFFGASSP